MAGKRKNGEGTFDQVTKSGIKYYRWRGNLGFDAKTGKPYRKTIYARTDKELRSKVAEAIAEYDRGAVNIPKRLTVGMWLNQWLTDCCGDVKERTRNTYKSAIETHIVPGLGNIRLSDLQPKQVQTFINKLDGVKPKTVKNIHGILHRALEVAASWGYIVRNPADNISLPRIEKQEVNFLAGDDLKRFIDAVKGNPYESMFLIAIFTGMREGELLGLPWDCIDFKKGTINVKQQLQLIRGDYVIVSTKSDKARLLSPAPFVFDILKEVKREQAKMKLQMGADWQNEYNLVFTRYTGENVARNTLYMNFKRCLAAAGLPETVRFHDLRHSYAVFALESGDNIKEIQAALGHFSSAFTVNTYAHVSENARKESAARQQEAINGLLGKSLG